MTVRVIAEAGVNHNGDINLAYELVDIAKDAGADIVKFQTAVPEAVVSKHAKMANYQIANIGVTKSQLEMTKEIHLPIEDFKKINNYCKKIGIEFATTAFDLQSLEFIKSLDLSFYKIPSGEITNLPYLREIARTHKPIIISTGMAEIQEIKDALEVLFQMGTRKEETTILHCTTQYPAPLVDINLLAILQLRDVFKLNIGYSDHSSGIEIPIAATALGATVIEKHFTKSRELAGPDHKASLEPHELKEMVSSIRKVEISLGDGLKRPMPSEIPNKEIARKSIVASKKILKGQLFTIDNLTTKRPGSGISPMRWDSVIGKTAPHNFEEDDLIEI
jgi:N,N'-diacetyllegionaminate synthase